MQVRILFLACILLLFVGTTGAANAPIELKVSQHSWHEFSAGERATILAKFPNIEIVPSENVGTIHSVQAVNRSTAGTHAGAALGSVLGQSLYIDNAFRGSGSNYSVATQLGAALVGGLLGSALDSAPQIRFAFNYGVKTLDGQVREVRIDSGDEFTRPVGQCVFLPSLAIAPPGICVADKVQFLRRLSALSQAPQEAIISQEVSGMNVKCQVPGVGPMTLDRAACLQMEGAILK